MSHLLVYFVANSCLFPIWSIAYAVDRRRSTQSDVLIFHGGDNLEPEPSADDVDPSDLRPLIDSQKERPEHKPPPCDRYHLFYAVSYLLGTSTLLPWYFFITCTEYWMYRFRNLPNSTVAASYALVLPTGEDNRDQLQADFMSYLSIASTIPSTVFLFANLFLLKRFSINGRVILSFIMLLALFVETTILILFDTDKWQWYFFVVTLSTVVLLNISTALLQAALCAIITRFPVRYISAFSSGQSVAGILAAVIRVWSLYASVDHTKSTFMYFTFADVLIFIAFCSYCGVKKTEFYEFYISPSTESGSRQLSSDHSSIPSMVDYRGVQMRMMIILAICMNCPPILIAMGTFRVVGEIQCHLTGELNYIIYPCAALFLCFVVTTCVYPSVTVLVESSNYPFVSFLGKYFVPVVSYLLYSVCEYSGRVLSGLIQKPKGKYAFWFSVFRISLIPLLMLCNAQPRHRLPVLFKSDLIYATIVILLALTNGYLANLSFVLMHKSVNYNEHEPASSILVIWLALGLSVGSLLSFPLVNAL